MRKTKLCKSCKEEIDAKASKCPHCQAKQSPGCLKVLILLFLGFILICFIAVGLANTSSDSSVSSPSANSDSNVVTAPQNHWKYSEDKDDFDGRESKYCSIDAENEIKGAVWGSKPRILVRLRGKKELDVMVIAEGVVFGHSGSSDKVRLKFDDEQPFNVGYDEAADGSPDKIFLRSASKIVERLKKSQKLVVELPVFMESGERATFIIAGYSEVCKI